MIHKTACFKNKKGLHARTAVILVNHASQFNAQIFLQKSDGNRANAKSIMNLFTLMAAKGDEVVISAEGKDAKEAVDAIAHLIDSGFHLSEELTE